MPIAKKIASVFLIGIFGVPMLSMLASPTVAQQKVCTVSDDGFAKARAAFAGMADVLRNPRCLNCHGGVDPFTAGKKHEGGLYDVIRDKGGDFLMETFDQCQLCHGDFPGWRVAPMSMSFVGKDNVELCKLIKYNSHSGIGLIDHLRSDRPPFIEVGFKGTRGLNEAGRSMVDNYQPDPIRGVTQGQLIQMANDWLAGLGTNGSSGDFITGDSTSDCGCVQHHYAFEVHSEATINTDVVHLESGFGSMPRIPIKFDKDGAFHSDKTPLTQTGAAHAVDCTAQSASQLTISTKGNVVGGEPIDPWNPNEPKPNDRINVTATGETTKATASAQCPKAGSISISSPGPTSKSFTIELDAVVGARSKPTPSLPGVQGAGGSTWIKLIQID